MQRDGDRVRKKQRGRSMCDAREGKREWSREKRSGVSLQC